MMGMDISAGRCWNFNQNKSHWIRTAHFDRVKVFNNRKIVYSVLFIRSHDIATNFDKFDQIMQMNVREKNGNLRIDCVEYLLLEIVKQKNLFN